MNLIPKVNGRVVTHKGKLTVYEPLGFQGELMDPAFSMRFGLLENKDGILYFSQDPAIPAEGYKLIINQEGIEISSSSRAGQFYGLITLQSLLREGRMGMLEISSKIPYMEIEDAPRFSHRGFMLDVSRHFTGVTEIEKVLEQMALLKMNVFHWHLSDDQGYRIESKAFPKLNSVGSVLYPGQATDGSKRGYYTWDEIREVVSFAAERNIMVIPEIDLPGHTSAIIAAYPELSCDGAPGEVKRSGGIFPKILCGGDPKVYDFLYQLLDEVTTLFPAPYFHLGGDEAPKAEWAKCGKCQAMIREKDLGSEEGLQAYFTEQLVRYLALKGKTAIGWNEILQSGRLAADTIELPEEAPASVGAPICQYWAERGKRYSYPEVKKGQRFIFSNNPCFYLDYPHAMVTMKAAYLMEPNIDWNFEIPEDQILGFEAPLWTERVGDISYLEHQIFPRLLAVSENGWTKARDYDEFLERVKAYEAVLKEFGIDPTPWQDADVHGKEGVRLILQEMQRMRGEYQQTDIELPEEVKKEFAESGKRFMEGFFHYSYTAEDQAYLGELLAEELKNL